MGKELDKVTYTTCPKVPFAEITVNGQKVRCRSFKMEHSVGEVPVVTLELLAPELRIDALCDLVSREYNSGK